MKTCDTQVFVEVTEQIKLNNNQHQTDYSPQVLKEFKEERAESVLGPRSPMDWKVTVPVFKNGSREM